VNGMISVKNNVIRLVSDVSKIRFRNNHYLYECEDETKGSKYSFNDLFYNIIVKESFDDLLEIVSLENDDFINEIYDKYGVKKEMFLFLNLFSLFFSQPPRKTLRLTLFSP